MCLINLAKRNYVTKNIVAEFSAIDSEVTDYRLKLTNIGKFTVDMTILTRTMQYDLAAAMTYRKKTTKVSKDVISVSGTMISNLPNKLKAYKEEGHDLFVTEDGNVSVAINIRFTKERAIRKEYKCKYAFVLTNRISGKTVVYTYDRRKRFLGGYVMNNAEEN